jgi:hypothetical protein
MLKNLSTFGNGTKLFVEEEFIHIRVHQAILHPLDDILGECEAQRQTVDCPVWEAQVLLLGPVAMKNFPFLHQGKG